MAYSDISNDILAGYLKVMMVFNKEHTKRSIEKD
jgi:hypothetical protein